MIRKVVRFSEATVKTIPNAKMYIEKFTSMQNKLKQQNKKIEQLTKQAELAQFAQSMTVTDQILKMLSNFTGRAFQSKAMRQLKDELISHRNQLQKKVHQSDVHWQKPREQIKKLRKQISNEFLQKFIKLQQNLLKNCSIENTSPELLEGFNLIHRLLLSALQKHGVKFFDPEPHSTFDPQMHDTAEEKAKKGQKIKAMISRGWKIDGKVVKKPMVRLQ